LASIGVNESDQKQTLYISHGLVIVCFLVFVAAGHSAEFQGIFLSRTISTGGRAVFKLLICQADNSGNRRRKNMVFRVWGQVTVLPIYTAEKNEVCYRF
jgi:hypothetical protein